MKKWIRLFTLVGISTQMTYAAELSESCQQSLKTQAIQAETARVTSKKQFLAGELQATSTEHKGVIDIHLTDDTDGRTVSYKAILSESSRASCEIELQRDTKSACRYSAYEGEDNLERIPGFVLDQNKVITGDNDATKTEAAQISKMLELSHEDGMTLKQLIETTGDQEILRYDITTPENKKLVYYKYYAGDTAVGTFYRGASVKSAGENNDGDICIKE